ncbi:DUF11 domain-containing protein [Paenibacillus sp. MMS18-CY102]|uniref:DUF11 domain-containing protein n=1 Tax=Paenibacillus sp. MMS18-CY102 TaxID=2682849 RepID=UPI0013654D95|nr:DUF11 domain-containing protein [Paenibacillus sp. MMS18-CY102]MWC28233.1 DUF11 domain-containing protein [Paenibacillus sp. MMS18-CY102]
MTQGSAHDMMLLNQTLVRFSSGSLEKVSYSNTVQTPLVGPLITAIKKAAPSQLALEQTVTYTLTIGNAGNCDAEVIVYDTLPAGLSFIPNSVLRDGSPIPGSKPATGIALGTIAVGTAVQLVFQAIMIAIPESLSFANQAHIAYRFTTQEGRAVAEAVQSNQVTTAIVPFQLHAYGQLSSPVTYAGDVLNYDIVLKNEGVEPIGQVTVHIPLPPGFTFVPGSVIINDVHTAWIDPDAGIPIGTIASGSTVTIRVSLRLNGTAAASKVTIQSVVDYTVNGQEQRMRTNTSEVAVIAPVVSVTLSANRAIAPVGSIIAYDAVVVNGSSFAVDAVLTDLLPPGTVLVPDSVIIDGVPRKGASLTNGISLGTLRAGAHTTIAYQVLIQQSAARVGLPPLANHARITYTFRLPDGRIVEQYTLSNAVVTQLASPILSVVAAAHPAEFVMGESVSFTFTITNEGNWDADTALFRSPYPPGFQLQDTRVNGKTRSGFPVNQGLPLGVISPGSSVRARYFVFVAELEDGEQNEVATRCIARYSFTYEGDSYTGECASNELLLSVDDYDE